MATKTLTISLEESIYNDAVEGFASRGWRPQVPEPEHPGQSLPNPQTKEEFAAVQVTGFVVASARGFARQRAAQEAMRKADADFQKRVEDATPTTQVGG